MLQKDPGKGEEIIVLFGSLHRGYCHLPAQMGAFPLLLSVSSDRFSSVVLITQIGIPWSSEVT